MKTLAEKIKIEIDIELDTGDYELTYKSNKGKSIELSYLHEIVTKVVNNWKTKSFD